MIVGICTTKNEADIIGLTVAHLFAEGVDHIIARDAMSADGTWSILQAFPNVTLLRDECEYMRQSEVMSELAGLALEMGADWVIPFDADEFWYSPHGPLCEVLPEVPESVGVLQARMYAHKDYDHRELDPKPLPKVCFRPAPGAWLAKGNHAVENVPGETRFGVVDLREIQFRSFDHFCRKVRERFATLNPEWPYSEGTHYRVWGEMSDEDLLTQWRALCAAETMFDPIPSR